MAYVYKDFGEKIGGARKDLWSKNGLTVADTYDMNENEKKKYVTKENIWPLQSSKKMVEEGIDPLVVYWVRKERNCVKPSPDDIDDSEIDKYIKAVSDFRDEVMSVRNESGIKKFRYEFHKNLPKWSNGVRISDAIDCCFELTRYKYRIETTGFPYGGKGERKQTKTKFVPPQLDHIERDGTNYRKGKNVGKNIWQTTFNFRGVEYGNWMSQNDRKWSTNYAYDALKDLAVILQIEDTDVSWNGKLALAFGARGTSRALAHYEPLRQVINLTKIRGAGSLAHEWGHALDHQIANFYGLNDETFGDRDKFFASEFDSRNPKLPTSYTNVLDSMCMNPETGEATEYFSHSVVFDHLFSKDGHGYWASRCELFARAFACYCLDKYDGRDDYLFAHAESCCTMLDGERICAYPTENERERINQSFDDLLVTLKADGLFHNRKADEKTECTDVPLNSDYNEIVDVEEDGQMMFLF